MGFWSILPGLLLRGGIPGIWRATLLGSSLLPPLSSKYHPLTKSSPGGPLSFKMSFSNVAILMSPTPINVPDSCSKNFMRKAIKTIKSGPHFGSIPTKINYLIQTRKSVSEASLSSSIQSY
jgi:hypothetical protein